jgi:hypothetical protein
MLQILGMGSDIGLDVLRVLQQCTVRAIFRGQNVHQDLIGKFAGHWQNLLVTEFAVSADT